MPSSELVDRPAPAYVFARERVTAKYAKQQAGRISRKEKKKGVSTISVPNPGRLKMITYYNTIMEKNPAPKNG